MPGSGELTASQTVPVQAFNQDSLEQAVAAATAAAGVAAVRTPSRTQASARPMTGLPSFKAMAASEMVP